MNPSSPPPWPERGPWADGHAPALRPVLVFVAVAGFLVVVLTAAVASRRTHGLLLEVGRRDGAAGRSGSQRGA